LKKCVKIISLLIVLNTLCAMTINSYQDQYIFEYPNQTVIFKTDTIFNSEERQYLAEYLIYGAGNVSPCGLTCILFGHDLKTGYMTTIKHKVYISQPRCVMETYESSFCTRCEYISNILIGSSLFVCCN